MSNSLFVILIENNLVDTKKLTMFLNKQHSSGLLYKLNEKWIVLELNDYIYEFEAISLSLSEKYKAKIVPFYESEDYGWGFKYYNQGKELFSLDVDIIQKEGSNIEIKGTIELLKDLIPNDNFRFELIDYNKLSDFLFLKKFKDTVQISQLTKNILNENEQHDSLVIHKFGKEAKKINVRKIILDSLQDKLGELNFYYNKKYTNNYSLGDYCFFNEDSGYPIGLKIYITENEIGFYVHTHRTVYNLSYETSELTDGKYRFFTSGSHLKYIIKHHLEHFKGIGLDLIKKDRYVPFNMSKATDEIISSELSNFNFIKKIDHNSFQCENNVEFTNNSVSLKIQYYPFVPGFTIYLLKENRDMNITELLDEYKMMWIGFLNKEEYSQKLKKVINELIENGHLEYAKKGLS